MTDERYTIKEIEAIRSELIDLKDQFGNGIKYDKALNCYVIVWTERQLEDSRKSAAELYEKLKWKDSTPEVSDE